MYVCKYIQIHTNIIYTYKNLKATDHRYMSQTTDTCHTNFTCMKRNPCLFSSYLKRDTFAYSQHTNRPQSGKNGKRPIRMLKNICKKSCLYIKIYTQT